MTNPQTVEITVKYDGKNRSGIVSGLHGKPVCDDDIAKALQMILDAMKRDSK